MVFEVGFGVVYSVQGDNTATFLVPRMKNSSNDNAFLNTPSTFYDNDWPYPFSFVTEI